MTEYALTDILKSTCSWAKRHRYSTFLAELLISAAILNGGRWTIEHGLGNMMTMMTKLNFDDDKTEFLVIGTRHQLSKLSSSVLHVGDHLINPSISVRNLGSVFDNSLSMDSHITQVCKTAFYHIHNIRKISKYLSRESLKTLVHAFITSRLDYCNSLFYGLPKYHLSKLQRVQNAAARLVTSTRKYDHITPVLYNLHWLPVFYRIYFKILILTFKAIHNMSPSYISNLVSIKTKIWVYQTSW